MTGRLSNTLKIALSVLPLLSLVGCCGEFFRGQNDVVAVTISPNTTNVRPGGTQQFKAIGTFAVTGDTGDVTAQTTWSSSNQGIATINSAGLATGVASGTATISGNCQCYVSKASLGVSAQAVTLVSIAVTPLTPSVGTGQTQQFIATGNYSDGSVNVITSSVIWTSSATTIATINSSGVATAVAAGNAKITASSGNISGSAVLTVV